MELQPPRQNLFWRSLLSWAPQHPVFRPTEFATLTNCTGRRTFIRAKCNVSELYTVHGQGIMHNIGSTNSSMYFIINVKATRAHDRTRLSSSAQYNFEGGLSNSNRLQEMGSRCF